MNRRTFAFEAKSRLTRDGLHYAANLTWSASRATIPSRPGESIKFPGHSDISGDLSIGWATARFFAGATGSYVSKQLLKIGVTNNRATI